ncbi:hypothetical protein RIF29_18865 [Crotalaria pallida]|uniref:GDSL esterase/lipase n=1 Tax=Crotalaria pallida TaxID=3830 RepID=A0AAN9F6Q9_CROPI
MHTIVAKRMSYLVGFLVFLLAGLFTEVRGVNVSRKCKYSAIYNFGDSNSDTGTTSAAFTTINPPNGEVFPQLIFPTRNCDGRLIIDFIDVALRKRLPKSVDFSKALYTIDIGQIDLAYSLFLNNNDYQSVKASIPSLLSNFSQGVQQLYDEGARFFWIHNTGSWGCVPRTNKNYKPSPGDTDSAGCRASENEIAREFNKQLKELVDGLRTKLPDAKFTYVDIYSAKFELTKNAKDLGFADPKEFCCGTIESPTVDCGVNAKEASRLCMDKSKYITWDGIHYSEAANKWVADRITNGSLSDPPVSVDMACH